MGKFLLFSIVLVIIWLVIIQIKITRMSNNLLTSKAFEELLESFVMEIERSNEYLLNEFTETKQNYEYRIRTDTSQIDTLDTKLSELSKNTEDISIQIEQIKKKLAAEAPSLEGLKWEQFSRFHEISSEKKPFYTSVRTRFPKIFEMYENGQSADEIATKLNMTKAEVVFILQVFKHEEL